MRLKTVSTRASAASHRRMLGPSFRTENSQEPSRRSPHAHQPPHARQRRPPPARTPALESGPCLLQSGAAACARKHRRLCDPRARVRRDAEGQLQPTASTERGRPLLKRGQCGTALPRRRAPHRDAAGQPCRPPSTSRTNLRHRRAPQKTSRRRHHRRSRVFLASILWPPIATTATCTTRPSARR